MALDAHYEVSRLAGVYDYASGWSVDRDFYLSLGDGKKLNVLDLGCGTGLLCDRFASRGHSVTGVDPSVEMLKIARQKLRGPRIHWVNTCAQNFASDKRFDLIVMTGHTFQVLLEEGDLRAVFVMMNQHLSPDGTVVFESRNPLIDWLNRWEFEKEVLLPTGEAVQIQRRVIKKYKEFLEFEILYQFADERLRSESKLRFWSREKIEAELVASGLKVTNLFGDWERSSFQSDVSEEMIFEVKQVFESQVKH